MPAAGVPERTPAEVSVTPDGRAPLSEKVADGRASAVAVNVPEVPTVKVAAFVLVITGVIVSMPEKTIVDRLEKVQVPR